MAAKPSEALERTLAIVGKADLGVLTYYYDKLAAESLGTLRKSLLILFRACGDGSDDGDRVGTT